MTAHIGGSGDMASIQQKALKVGTFKVLTLDARKTVGLCERLARVEAGKLFYRFS